MIKTIKKAIGMGPKNNFVNVRIATSGHSKEINDIKHNLRHVNSLSTKDNEHRNYHYIMDQNGKFTPEKDKVGYNIMKDKFHQMRAEHNEIFYKNNGRKLRDRNATFLNCVITFSEELKDKYENDPGNFDKNKFHRAGLKALQEIAQHLGTELLYFSVHYDETTPHFQAHFKNYDESGKSIFYKNRTKEKLEILQDIGIKHMQKFDPTMQRGIKKEKPVQHHHFKDHLEKQKAKEVNKYNQEIQNQRDILKREKEKLKLQRNQVKTLDIDIAEKKREYAEITKKQKQIREQEKLLIKYKQDIKNLLSKNENLQTMIHKINDIKHSFKLENKELAEKNRELETTNKELKEDASYYKEKYFDQIAKLSDIPYMEEQIKLQKEYEQNERIKGYLNSQNNTKKSSNDHTM